MKTSRLSILVPTLLVAALVCGAAWRWGPYWTPGTPEHSLRQIKQAIEQHDLGRLQQYVDLDALARAQAEEQQSQIAAHQPRVVDQSGRDFLGTKGGNEPGRATIVAMDQGSQDLLRELSARVRAGYEADSRKESEELLRRIAGTGAVAGIPVGRIRVGSLKRTDASVEVGLLAPDGNPIGGEPGVRLTMRKQADGRWRVISVHGV